MKRFLIAFLLVALPISVMADDLRYVDSPAGRALPDHARADTFSSSGSADSSPEFTEAEGAAEVQTQLNLIQNLTEQAVAQSNQARQQAGLNGMENGGIAGMDQSMGGGMYAMPGQVPGIGGGPTPMQQIGAGLAQDAGGFIDAGIQRQINGSNGRVIVAPQFPYPAQQPAYPGQPGLNQLYPPQPQPAYPSTW